LRSGLLASALSAQHLDVVSASAWSSIDDLLADPDWDLGLVLSPFKAEVGARIDQLSVSSERTGIVDTLIRQADAVVGLNTNSWALGAALSALVPGAYRPRILILGAGGTTRSALLAIARRWDDAEVFVSARRKESAAELLDRFAVTFVEPANTPDLGVALIINSTTWGETAESESTPFAFPATHLLRPGTVFFDLNNRRSALQDDALAAGCTVMSGTLMQRATHACRAAAARFVLDGGDR
jgi:shikimate dehydrogenase